MCLKRCINGVALTEQTIVYMLGDETTKNSSIFYPSFSNFFKINSEGNLFENKTISFLIPDVNLRINILIFIIHFKE